MDMNAISEGMDFPICSEATAVQVAVERIRAGLRAAGFSPREQDCQVVTERRSEVRHPLVTGALLMPVEVEGERATPLRSDHLRMPAITLEISSRGVGVQHEAPLVGPTYALVCDICTDDPITLIVERVWTRRENESVFGCRSGFVILAVAERWDGSPSGHGQLTMCLTGPAAERAIHPGMGPEAADPDQ